MSPSVLPQDRSPRPWLAKAALVLAGVVVAISFLVVAGLFLSSFYFDPDDYPAEYYREEVVKHGRNLRIALLLPMTSMILSAIAWTTSVKAGARITGAVWAVGISILVAVAMIYAGKQNIEVASRLAETL